jgi:acyl-coenzyme A synthetase/AMP-(fatty) acid ligase
MSYNQTVLSRNIIADYATFYQHDYHSGQELKFTRDQFVDMVNYWKIFLVEKYQAGPGKKIIIDSRYLYYFTAVFAVWELGMTLIVDWNHAYSESDLDSKEYGMHGHIDYIICHEPYINPESVNYAHWDLQRNKKYCQHVISDKEFDTYTIQNPSQFTEIAHNILANPDGIAIQTATSGSTGMPNLKQISHKHVCLQAYRLTELLNFGPTDSTLHSVTLHHGASACYHFLPSFIQAKDHYILFTDVQNQKEIDHRSNYIIKHKINKLFLYTTQQLTSYLESTPVVEHQIDITTLFRITDNVVALAKQKNIATINSTFGDTNIGYGILIKSWTKSDDLSQHNVTCMGPRRDDFFDLKIENGHLYVKSPAISLNDWRTSCDRFELKDGLYYFFGRDNVYRIGDEWVNHGQIEAKLLEFFPEQNGVETATIVIDNEQQQVYLAIWGKNDLGELAFNDYIKSTYKQLRINKTVRELDPNQFMGARKISRQKLRECFRNLTPSEITK